MRPIKHVSAASRRSEHRSPAVLAVMEDHELVEHVARRFVRRHGICAVEVLHERADCCAGDYRSADAWLDIAEAAERLLSCDAEGE